MVDGPTNLASAAEMTSTSRHQRDSGGRPLRVGHRGAAGHRAENTLPSIDYAIGLECDWVELDVQETGDGHLVLMHDKRVDRTTDGVGVVAELSYSDIQSLRCADSAIVPPLDAALSRIDGRCGAMLEIITPGSALKVLRAVQRAHRWSPVIFSSFLHGELVQIRRTDPTAVTMALFECVPVDPMALLAATGATHVGISLDSTTREFVERLRSLGFGVYVYTVNDPRDIAMLDDYGLEGMISDFPERIRASP